MKFAFGFVACLTILCTVIPASAQFEQAVWDTITADTLQDRLSPGGLATNGYEECHLTYAKHRLGGGWNVYYRYFDLFGGAGSPTVVDSTRPCFGPVVASRYGDEWYNIDILYESEGQIYRCSGDWHGGSFDCAAVTNTDDPKFSPCVAWGSNYLHGAWIVYANSEYKIAYMRADTGGPAIEIIQDSELGDFGSGAQPTIVAVGDVPHIFYRGVNGANYRIHHAYRVHPDSAWTIEYLFTPNADDFLAAVDYDWGRLELAISGNVGWGVPGHIYYLQYDLDTHRWSTAELATGQYSAANARIVRAYSTTYVASCGTSGNFYNGDIYLSTKTGTDAFQTALLGNFQSVMQPLITSIVGEHGVLVFDAPVGADEQRNVELFYYGPDMTTAAHEPPTPSARGFCRAYPNPFNAATTIQFALERPARVRLKIFDIVGREIGALADRDFPAGRHSLLWNAADQPSGIYFYRLRVGYENLIGKMTMLK